MRILFVHRHFPGQYKHLAPAVARRPGVSAVGLSLDRAGEVPGVKTIRYRPTRGTSPTVHPWVSETETKAIRGEAAARAALKLKADGFTPDVICAHPGWGEALFLKDVWPGARMLGFMEFYYHAEGYDVGFDAEFAATSFEDRARLRMKNAAGLLSLDACDWGVSPTHFQKSTYPACWQRKISVIHDGIDTDALRPRPDITATLPDGATLTARDEVITFINRNLEPYRGFHVFMRALPEIQRRRPSAHVLIIGGTETSYGRRPPGGRSWKDVMLEEVGHGLDLSRVHFLGNVAYPTFVGLMQLSAAHVYLTYPFVLSWSMLEAMSCGALVIGSATPPVMEVIEDGHNGLLVDFFDQRGLADAVDRVLDHPDRMTEVRARARRTVVERYDLKRICLPRHLALIEAVTKGELPP